MGQKVILDTDIGGDIDDAVALACFLKSDVELLGVIAAYSNVRTKAMFARKFISLSDKSAPVFYGVQKRECTSGGYITEADYNFLSHSELACSDAAAGIHPDGIEFMVSTVLQNPGEVSLISIGPATNIARAFLLEPSIADQVNAVYLMSGCFDVKSAHWQLPEHNLRKDKKAVRLLCNQSCKTYFVGKEIGRQACLHLSDIHSQNDRLLCELYRQAGIYFNFFTRKQNITHMCDPLTIGAILFPELYQFDAININLDNSGRPHPEKNSLSNVHCCTGVGAEIKEKLLTILHL